MHDFDYVVIGAGPSGLTFASSLDKARTLIVDAGRPAIDRCRNQAEDCVLGAGGAGLFSDGKFSFYPSATAIWQEERESLEAAYQSLHDCLSPFAEVPPFPSISNEDRFIQERGSWGLKPYPSIYLGLEVRLKLIEQLCEACGRIAYETEYLRHEALEGGGHSVYLRDRKMKLEYSVSTKKLILAGGRFMPLFLSGRKLFRRYEFGFRIEGPAELFKKEKYLRDPKYVLQGEGVEYRTFCWCERGEVVQTSFRGINTYSGRADCTPTEKSNFGFNIRVKDKAMITDGDFKELLGIAPFRIPLHSGFDSIIKLFPKSAAQLVKKGLEEVFQLFPQLECGEVNIIGPSLEGVGAYPELDSSRAIKGCSGVYVIGDCGGSYRGIIAAMLSGYLLAHQQVNEGREHEYCDVVCT